ncbi:MAG TPA: methionine--tRNA ligase [bacterium]|nr:methionine--tRNA ligase [bacterium]
MKKFYITTPLYYVNAKPHIGHAYTNILCDAYARYRRLRHGDDSVFFLTGTDEHGTKIEKAAKENGKGPKAYADEMVPVFKELWEILGISYDYFIRTTDDAHKTIVGNILRDLELKQDIYPAKYEGWYCTPCESFWTELQLLEGKCPDCHREVQKLSEENYFFKLSKYHDWLVKYIQDNPKFIQPEIRRNEILGFLREPLEDLCITRPRSRLNWGIDYPNSKDHVVYVWFDALVNYISAVGYTVDSERFNTYWPADVHMVGKDILRHHAVYWPIMLKACGLQMPKAIIAHGWWTMGGQKVSKSRGNAVDPFELVKKYGADAFRYYLLHEVTVGYDGTFSEDLLRERYITDLSNDLGNLWFRLATMLEKYFGGQLPKVESSEDSPALRSDKLWMQGMWESFTKAVEINNRSEIYEEVTQFDPRLALDAIWDLIKKANKKIEEKKPWILAKDPAKKTELAETLIIIAEWIAHIACLLQPFLPETAKKILKRLNLPEKVDIAENEIAFGKGLLSPGLKVERGEALFPKLEEDPHLIPPPQSGGG